MAKAVTRPPTGGITPGIAAGNLAELANAGRLPPSTQRQFTDAELMFAERVRISAILESPEGIAHPATARELALRSNMAPDQALALMGRLPRENPAADAFLDAMGREAVGITPGIAASEAVHGDAKAARLEELKAAGRAVAEERGYRIRTVQPGV